MESSPALKCKLGGGAPMHDSCRKFAGFICGKLLLKVGGQFHQKELWSILSIDEGSRE
jgi:hypothetical protein